MEKMEKIQKQFDELRFVWKKIYREWFDLDADFSDLEIPDCFDAKYHYGIIVPKDLKVKMALEALRKESKVFYAHDEDDDDVISDRYPTRDYVVMFKKNFGPGSFIRIKDWEEKKEERLRGMTVLERVLLEIYGLSELDEHLDYGVPSFCSGSRPKDGGKLHFFWLEANPEFFITSSPWIYARHEFVYHRRVASHIYKEAK